MERPFLDERRAQAAGALLGPGSDQEARYRRRAEETDPDWAELTAGWIWGMYSREVLPHKTRELCAVAALAVLQHGPELKAHLRIALRFNAVEEVREVLLQMAVYAGMPVALESLKLLREVLAERDAEETGSSA